MLSDGWVKDIFTNRPTLLERVIIRRESKSGKVNYEIAYTVYDDDDDLIWEIKNKYLGVVTHFKRFDLLPSDMSNKRSI